MATQSNEEIQIAGAGPAGLAAAITLARAGKQVIVHEAQANVGCRFKRDFQGLENWTTREDVLETFADDHISIDFNYLASKKGVAFDAWEKAYTIDSDIPLFYLIERGPRAGSLDFALLKQAQQLDVDVRFNSRVKQLAFPAILATGPKAADAIAIGYHFDTEMEDGYWVICDDSLAPGGYAYLLIWNGRGTIKSCMFSSFKEGKQYGQRTMLAFKKLVGLKMNNIVEHAGVGNFYMPGRVRAGNRPIVGEQAGFQDALWGFGIRLAMTSGVLAARSLLNEESYEHMCAAKLQAHLKVSIVNRAFYNNFSNRGYRWFLKYISGRKNIRKLLFNQYQPSLMKSLLFPLANRIVKPKRKDDVCQDLDCMCVWCRSTQGLESSQF